MAWMRSDDLDGTPASLQTFGLFGKAYMVSLGDVNRAKLEKALQPFLTVATPYGVLPVPPEEKIVYVSEPVQEQPQVEAAVAEPAPAPVPAKKTPRQRRRQARAVTPVVAAGTPHRTIRAWANDNGYQVGPQGRIPTVIMEAFAAQQTG